MSVQTALGLAKLGLHVFPVVLTPDPKTGKHIKQPMTENGFYDGTDNPEAIKRLWKGRDDALVGVHVGPSGIVALDLDVKRDADGNVLVDGFDTLDASFLSLPDTYGYTTVGGEGAHYIFAAPADVTLNGQTGYRKMKGVDRRGGDSYIVWNGDVPTSRDALAPAPEWLCDAVEIRSAAHFEGTVRDWYDSLEPGTPNLLVRNAIERLEHLYRDQGDDLGHSDMVEAQHNAIRLGAEGNPGVPEFLAKIEEVWLNRDPGAHGTPETEWSYKFQEALASGIEKHGAAISLRADLPQYSLAMVPADTPDSLVNRQGGDRGTFRDLLADLTLKMDDDLAVTSILWNAPSTRELAHEWGLEFVHKRVVDTRTRPEPIRENPTLKVVETPADVVDVVRIDVPDTFLSADEASRVEGIRTFIDTYVAASGSKGYSNLNYDVPAAWTALSMAFGRRAYIPKGKPLEFNLWYVILGYSGTGKSASVTMLHEVLDLMFKDGETYYNLGANSTLAGLQTSFIDRDGKPSMVLHDEAADFFDNLKSKDYMRELEDNYSKWYDGGVDPSNKVSLGTYKGKGASTSFNVYMLGTPDRMTETIDTSMFRSGFAARVNWGWAPPPADDDMKYKASLVETDDSGRNPHSADLAADLAHAASLIGGEKRAKVGATDEALNRLVEAHKAFDLAAKSHERYDAVEPAVTRLGRETIWKCAGLLALYRGETTITLDDALVAIHYASAWFQNLLKVADATSEGEFSRDVNEIEAYVKAEGGSVSQTKLSHRFRTMIRRSPRELTDRIDFLVVSGRLNRREGSDRKVRYEVNGGE